MPPLDAFYVLPARTVVLWLFLAAGVGAAGVLLGGWRWLRRRTGLRGQARCRLCGRFVRGWSLCPCLTRLEERSQRKA